MKYDTTEPWKFLLLGAVVSISRHSNETLISPNPKLTLASLPVTMC